MSFPLIACSKCVFELAINALIDSGLLVKHGLLIRLNDSRREEAQKLAYSDIQTAEQEANFNPDHTLAAFALPNRLVNPSMVPATLCTTSPPLSASQFLKRNASPRQHPNRMRGIEKPTSAPRQRLKRALCESADNNNGSGGILGSTSIIQKKSRVAVATQHQQQQHHNNNNSFTFNGPAPMSP